MCGHKLPHRNPSSDGEERCPRNQTPQSRFSSSSQIRKPGETLRGCTVGEASTLDRIPNKVLIHDEEEESDEEWMCRDDDSDDLTLETAKNSKWLRDFFGWLDSLSKDQIDDPTIKMHCPACKDVAGANVWYKGFHAVITHAENLRSKRVRLHRKFAEILEGELRNRRSTFSKHEEFSEWKGKGKEVDDQMIVWPPMVIIQNTRSHKDETGKKMEENGDKLIEQETKDARETEENKTLMETNNDAISQKLRLRELEIQTIRRRITAELEESKQEMEYMVKYYADVIKQLAEDHEMERWRRCENHFISRNRIVAK